MSLTFSAVHPVAPVNLSAVIHPWNATILWKWTYSSYSSFALECEVEVNSSGNKKTVRRLCARMTFVCLNVENIFSKQYSLLCTFDIALYICVTISLPYINKVNLCVQHTFSGVGLQSVVLSDMHPNEEYALQVRCGAQKNFWKWGDWSKRFSFKTSTTGKVFRCSRVVSEVCHFINQSILAGYLCLYIVVSSFSSRRS